MKALAEKPAAVHEANRMRIEVAGPHAVASWDPDYHRRVNYADEDLILRIFSDGKLVAAHRVNLLSQKEFAVTPGAYRVELARAFRPEVEVRTTQDQVPGLVWLSDSPANHVILWYGMDWPFIQREVERLHHLNWEKQAEVAVRLVQNGTVRWIPVPERDHVTLQERVEQIELCVRQPGQSEPLKTLFLARRPEQDVRQVFAAVDFPVAPPAAFMRLRRELVETDSLQLRVDWDLAGQPAPDPLRLVLECGGKEFRPHEERKVAPQGDYYFFGLEPGTYRARLMGRGKKAVLESAELHLPKRANRAVLMPMSETMLYCYWHIEADTWTELAARHGDLLGRVRCLLKVFHEWAGSLWHQPDLDQEVNLDSARDYWLHVPADKVYRIQLLAWIDGWIAEPLTDVSGPAQTGRLGAGSNPVAHLHVEQRLEHPTIRRLEGPTGVSSYSIGYLLLHLHAHLPFIPDPVHFGEKWRPEGYPQEWFPEAVRETYLPLLDMMEGLVSEGVDFRLSMDLSPPLVAMMRSARHQADVVEYLNRLIRLARLEVARTSREEPHYTTAANMHLRHLRRCRDLFLGYGCDLARAFRQFQDAGKLEICTCVGTHPMLPLWTTAPNAIRGQVFAAAEYHHQVFGRASLGVWLPECAYVPGVEGFLEEAGFGYFFSEGSTVLRADSPTEFGLNAPVYVRASQMTVFPRDPETSEQVWSGDMGYPGDPDYLEFHIRGGVFKYNRITDRSGGWKEPYNPEWASGKAYSHARHFLQCRNARFEWLRPRMWKKPIVVAPYDAELFGHHWYEGPQFLSSLFRSLHYDQNITELVTPSAYLAANPTAQEMWPNVSSWGDKGTFEKWMSGSTAWMYRHAHEAAEEMGRMAATRPPEGTRRRILRQAARQLMLAMSSDLPFVISNGHFVDRMKDLFFGALRDFWRLQEMFWDGDSVDMEFVRHLELVNCIFPEVNPDHFAG
ncbi:MAG: 1,4-alpha-glucan branching protein domain-containing protein [Candidatus Eremiobacterota bacterium]